MIDGVQIIISAGQALVVYLGGILPIKLNSIIVAFEWLEESVCNYNMYYNYAKNFID